MLYMILDMLDDMNCELKYAKRYYYKALNLKHDHPDLARKYINIAKEELNHATILYDITEALAKEMPEKSDIIESKHQCYTMTFDEINYKLSKFML